MRTRTTPTRLIAAAALITLSSSLPLASLRAQETHTTDQTAPSPHLTAAASALATLDDDLTAHVILVGIPTDDQRERARFHATAATTALATARTQLTDRADQLQDQLLAPDLTDAQADAIDAQLARILDLQLAQQLPLLSARATLLSTLADPAVTTLTLRRVVAALNDTAIDPAAAPLPAAHQHTLLALCNLHLSASTPSLIEDAHQHAVRATELFARTDDRSSPMRLLSAATLIATTTPPSPAPTTDQLTRALDAATTDAERSLADTAWADTPAAALLFAQARARAHLRLAPRPLRPSDTSAACTPLTPPHLRFPSATDHHNSDQLRALADTALLTLIDTLAGAPDPAALTPPVHFAIARARAANAPDAAITDYRSLLSRPDAAEFYPDAAHALAQLLLASPDPADHLAAADVLLRFIRVHPADPRIPAAAAQCARALNQLLTANTDLPDTDRARASDLYLSALTRIVRLSIPVDDLPLYRLEHARVLRTIHPAARTLDDLTTAADSLALLATDPDHAPPAADFFAALITETINAARAHEDWPRRRDIAALAQPTADALANHRPGLPIALAHDRASALLALADPASADLFADLRARNTLPPNTTAPQLALDHARSLLLTNDPSQATPILLNLVETLRAPTSTDDPNYLVYWDAWATLLERADIAPADLRLRLRTLALISPPPPPSISKRLSTLRDALPDLSTQPRP